jgi:hypothetical protein
MEFIKWEKKAWDVMGLVGGLQINFLIDTGSTATILSKTLFDSLDPQQQPSLQGSDQVLVDVNNHEITIYGHAEIPVRFRPMQFTASFDVCDLLNDGILGQDFLKYVQQLNLKKKTPHAKQVPPE